MANQTKHTSDALLADNTDATTTLAYHAELKTEGALVKAGEPVTLKLMIRDAKGGIVRNLQVVHESLIHLLVISDDLSEFYHLHPEQQSDGTFDSTHIFPQAGNYWLYVDYTPPNTSQRVDQLGLKVSGKERTAVVLVEDESAIKTVDGLRVTLKPSKSLRAGEEVMLGFAITDERTNEPVTDIQPYLGALAHFVIISTDGTEFLHAHPMEKTEKLAAHDVRHEVIQVSAHTSFPRAGLYKVWAQFQRSGQIITVPFVVRVADGEAQVN